MELWQFYHNASIIRGKKSLTDITDLENAAWNNLKNRSKPKIKKNDDPIYGIDDEVSLFEKDDIWNMNNFSSEHSIIHGDIKIPGVNTTFVNIGMQNTWFALHCEDSDLASMNLLHSGKPKIWYCVPKCYGPKLEKLVLDLVGDQSKCKTVYRHKCFLVSPSLLKEHGK